MARRENQGDERCGEEHFDNRDIAVIAAEYPRKRIRVVDAEAFGCACEQPVSLRYSYRGRQKNSAQQLFRGILPTARQLWSWLKVMKLRVGVDIVVVRREMPPGEDGFGGARVSRRGLCLSCRWRR